MSPTKNSSSAPLAELSPNTTSPSKLPSDAAHKSSSGSKVSSNPLDKMPATAAFPIHNDHTSTYISPSDAVLSPTSKKLSEIKGRRIMRGKQALGGRELFAKLRAQNEKNSGAVSPISLSRESSAQQSSEERSQ
jgi:hypothetical protein